MKTLQAIIAGAFLILGMTLFAQHQQGMIENTTAPMSDKVIRQRLNVMGYSEVRITKTNTLKYEIHAMKQGQPVVLNFHPQSGLVHDATPGRAPVRPWTMPVEPPSNMRIREEIRPR